MTRLRVLLCVAAVLLLTAPAFGMFEESQSGVRPAGMAGAFTAIADDASAIDYNPAGLFQMERNEVQAFGRLPYGGIDAGLHAAQVSGCVPTRKLGTFGLRLQESGIAAFSQRSLKIAHGFRLADDLAFGYGLNGYNLAQQDYGQGFAFGLDLGMFARIYRIWSIGFYAHNLNMPQMGSSDLPRLLVVGLGFSPQAGINSSLDVSKEPGQPTRVSVGQEFRIVEDYLTLRAGVSTEPVRMAFGLRTGYKNIHVDYALRTHSQLPLTHDLGLSVEF